MRALVSVALSLGLFLAAAGAGAQQNWNKLNAWRLVCDQQGACQIRNSVRRGGKAISHIHIYRVGKAEILEYRVPLGVDLRKGVALRIDRRQRFATQMLNCKADGCVGFASVTTALLKAMASGEELDLVYRDYDTDREIAITYNLLGFTRSYNVFYEQ